MNLIRLYNGLKEMCGIRTKKLADKKKMADLKIGNE